MIGKTNALVNGISAKNKPNIDFDGKWSGWHVEFYDGKPYWEALFASSGTLTNYGDACTCDAWGIGGGGAGGCYYSGGYMHGNGAGSGYTNMAKGITIPKKTTAITIGAGASDLTSSGVDDYNTDNKGLNGGTTTFLALSASGGSGAYKGGAKGGSNGSANYHSAGGENGTPGAGKIMSKFWSTEHNTEYGAGGVADTEYNENGGGGGGYTDVGAPNSTSGHGYGAGGGGAYNNSNGVAPSAVMYDWRGKSGCLIIRIAA